MFRTAPSLLLAGLLAGASLTTQAQNDPTKQLQPDHYYLNGKPATKAEVEALNPKTIKKMETFTGPEAVAHSHDATSKKVVLITTK